jgi:signal transduction histidine kinase
MKDEPIAILLVDDVEENLIAMEALLRRDGVDILLATSGREALELLLAREVALALLDVQMPEMNGFELAELIRGAERTKHVPIIFVTAGARDPHRVFEGYETGAVDFLFKPVDPHALTSKVDVFIALYRQRRELAEALRLNEMFVAILGHDLRNPLGALVLGTQQLERHLADSDTLRPTVARMRRAGARMTEMIDQLLDLTRARLGGGLGFARDRRAVDVTALVRRIADEVGGAHPDRRIDVEGPDECVLSGDPQRLLQLFSNLLGNAIQHGAAGPVTVTVTPDGGFVRIDIHNPGAIPASKLATLFDPFRSRDPDASGGGLGLGLFIAEQIALAHGGSIAPDSAPETGTRFVVRLPCRDSARDPHPDERQ